MTSHDTDATLTRNDCARILRVSVRSVGRLIANGKLAAFKLSATQQGRVRIPADALAEFVRSRRS
ncbi:MAG: helix-turn-helix domain-containing protein [Planctomycetes bacterium]|nr:helix-turn-helix domain-containing protein [Planctomycetota bacterium]